MRHWRGPHSKSGQLHADIEPFKALRLYPPLPHNARVALEDSILPVGGGEDGLSPVFVPAGTNIEFQAFALHRRKDLWGEDAEEFRPERWENEVLTSWVCLMPAINLFSSRLLLSSSPNSSHSR